jgi:tetratricopeptide (TPR) repeat protein
MNNNNKPLPLQTTLNKPQPSKVQHLWKHYFDKEYQIALEKVSKKFVDDAIPEMMHVAGLSMVSGGKPEMGLSLLKTASLMMPQVINWYANAAVVLSEKYPQEALLFLDEGLTHHKYDTLYFLKGNAYTVMENFPEAKEAFLKGLELNPNSVEILLNLGNIYRRLDAPQDAFKCYERILEIDPKNHRAQFNHASFRMSKGEHVEKAKEMCLDYLKIEDSAEVAFMLSLFLLDEGNYIDGWEMYSRRWESTLTLKERLDFRAPVAKKLEQLNNNKCVVFHEQGFGDSLQFCRYLNLIEKPENITVVVPTPLLKLFKNSFPKFKVTNARNDAVPYDYEVPLLNLPMIFKTTMDTVPNQLPYLIPEKIVKTPAKIGLVWAGHKRDDPDLASVDGRRSASFETFNKYLLDLELEFGSLQLGVPAAEAENHPIIKLLNPSFDFADSLEIVCGLDLVISVDTAPAHLAAAGGVETWIISRKDSCWRWSQELHEKNGELRKTEWYPNVKMFYQKEKGDWSHPFLEIREELKKRCGLI